jgi:hypothetical protein
VAVWKVAAAIIAGLGVAVALSPEVRDGVLNHAGPEVFSRVALRSNTVRSRVLFVGNSYTFVNDLPACVSRIDPGLATFSVTAGGQTLSGHLREGMALREIASGRYDVVVLQEQSLAPLISPDAFESALSEFARATRAQHARPILYETWSRARPGDPAFNATDTSGPADMDSRLEEEFRSAAGKFGLERAPVGAAFSLLRIRGRGERLIAEDGSHPTPEGTYLAALVIVQAIIKKPLPDSAPRCFTTSGVDAHELLSTSHDVDPNAGTGASR